MNFAELLNRSTLSHEPLSVGEWGTLFFRPDLASQQEFVVGAVAAISNVSAPFVKWVPSFSVLSKMYGDSTSSGDIRDLLIGSEQAISGSFRGTLDSGLVGTPHLRLANNGYFAADNIDLELTQLLKRHASVIWSERNQREELMGDDWAYSEMIKTLDLQTSNRIVIPGRSVVVDGRQVEVAFNNGLSYGSVVSARYSNFSTVERHMFLAQLNVVTAHKLARRNAAPAIFLVLPPTRTPHDVLLRDKSLKFLADLEFSGIAGFADSDVGELAQLVKNWASF